MVAKTLCTSLLLALPSLIIGALNPSCAPGGNLNLLPFNLQLPIGSAGDPTTITAAKLKGCAGYQDPGKDYFYTDPTDGSVVMKVPGSPSSTGCVTTTNSQHCRTEFREDSPSSWDPNAAVNRMNASLMVVTADDSSRGTVIGQIHMDASASTKPVVEIYINKSGVISAGVESTRKGGDEVFKTLDTVPLNQRFSYEVRYEGSVLSIGINGGTLKTLNATGLDTPLSYFKAGNYNQGESPSEVHFFDLQITH
ncbi:hypothetical protein B7494_g8225 [Chlorociboria aeruginascens]|nr:hypothetical protein B7494_g8225 [Chlorociboria aeruginascens]